MSVYINQNDLLPVRFFSYAKLGLNKNIQPHEKNLAEKIGDAGLTVVEELPRKVWKFVRDPRVVTIALTAFAMIATSFAFYPATTLAVIKGAITLLPKVPFWAAKFALYIATISTILSYSLRAQGRFWNEALMADAERRIAANMA